MSDSLPDYAPRLDALHAALVDEFDGIVASLNLSGDEEILDAGCGTGFFTNLLAKRLTAGRVHALDSLEAFLDVAGSRLSGLVAAGRVRLVQGDVGSLPFESGSLDVVWSAHSMQSYDDIPGVLAEFRRVLKPGGRLAVLESDALHSIMVPWPARLELAVRQAELRLLGDQDERRGAYFPRYAGRLLGHAGFENVAMRQTLAYRQGPLDGPVRTYVRLFAENLIEQTRDQLDRKMLAEVKKHLDLIVANDSVGGGDVYFGSLQALIIATLRA